MFRKDKVLNIGSILNKLIGLTQGGNNVRQLERKG